MRCGGPWIGSATTDMSRIAIVAALEREVRPLVKPWRRTEKQHDQRRFQFFENDRAVLVCGGIGAEGARRAAEAILTLYRPRLVYSVGYAGALEPGLRVGEVLTPARVIDAGDGSSIRIPGGNSVLVSYNQVAGPEQKSKLWQSYGAQAVDMESAAVARAAELKTVPFKALKVISDEYDFDLPDTDRFVDSDGRFRAGPFAVYAALRPWLWGRVIRLKRNSARATKALCRCLSEICGASAGPTSAI
jgi:adenosylhomocysteine nucleosidase